MPKRRKSNTRNIGAEQFEQRIAQLYEAMGYKTRRRGHVNQPDQGVDIEARRGNEYLVIQCKNYAGNVGLKEVQALAGAVVKEKATKGVLVTTGSFTSEARIWSNGLAITLYGPHEIAHLEATQPKPQPKPQTLPPKSAKSVIETALEGYSPIFKIFNTIRRRGK